MAPGRRRQARQRYSQGNPGTTAQTVSTLPDEFKLPITGEAEFLAAPPASSSPGGAVPTTGYPRLAGRARFIESSIG
ncbi:hypothetical protein CABS01_12961 [Colletotrichum abscissum]|uniref:uncharacterized protein n=1 Tax=Colletotrichum abscissum TaxID=1671311 RepID=UPI0027D58CF6|nr:uncharacterized protein CABS01_12961 [Colletotrichum abscissum]KAK1487482.1 hypothetical protein CABS01_12961 [Colletotrichum abscissum]